MATPWSKILTSRAVWACWIGHFAGDWGAYTMLVSLPSFLKDVLGFDLSAVSRPPAPSSNLSLQLGIISAIPYIAYFLVINVGGILSDFVRSRKIFSTLNTRRAAMLVGNSPPLLSSTPLSSPSRPGPVPRPFELLWMRPGDPRHRLHHPGNGRLRPPIFRIRRQLPGHRPAVLRHGDGDGQHPQLPGRHPLAHHLG